MPGTMLLHDARLEGRAPSIAENTYEVDKDTDLHHALRWIAWYANSRAGLRHLWVMCHGFYGNELQGKLQMSSPDETLGFGLQLCKQGLDRSNVDQTYVLKGHVSEITLYACGPANTRRGLEGTFADGRMFCSELAYCSGATVIAASQTQLYDTSFFGNVIDFGTWEGPVFRFSPDGSVSQVK